MQENATDLNYDNPEKRQEVLYHSGTDLQEVMKDIFAEHPEESFYFLNKGGGKKTAEIFQEEFLPDDPRRRIAYAMKANSHPEVLKMLIEAGIGAVDCSSNGEITQVHSEHPSVEIFFNNPHKKEREIRAALAQGVRHFTADLPSEVEKILSLTSGNISPEIAVRIKTLNPDGAKINLSKKYGILPEEAEPLFHQIQESSAKPCISMNVGSQVLDIESYRKNFNVLVELIQSMRMRVMAINVGGGMPVLLDKSVEENQDILRKYLQNITQVIREQSDNILLDSEDAKIIIEPGRSMIASSIDLAISIINTNPKERTLMIDDGVFTSFSDSVFYDWKYIMHGIDAQGKKILNRDIQDHLLYGRTCDSIDQIAQKSLVTGLTRKDYLHIPNAGVLSSKTSKFNGYPVHRYVVYNS